MAKNRSEVVAEVAGKTDLSQNAVNRVLDALFDILAGSLATGEKVSIPGWLAVERTERAARTGRNPQTGQELQIPAGFGVKITAGSKLKAAAAK
ncbi:HU family DNA-binding protein [Sinomonas sp.]|uniref:HU family DNA-binding protein n=1 Tax=Sinomonas sp. TaxID=1914986 RepID=UPI002FE03249